MKLTYTGTKIEIDYDIIRYANNKVEHTLTLKDRVYTGRTLEEAVAKLKKGLNLEEK